MQRLKKYLSAIQAYYGRVFVRTTFYVVALLFGFAGLVTGINYYNDVWEIEERLLDKAHDHATLVSRIAAREIKQKQYTEMETLLDALAGESLVVAARAYTRLGHVFASDITTRLSGRETFIDENVLTAIESRKPFTREDAETMQYILPVKHAGETVGAVSITMSKEEIGALKLTLIRQSLMLMGILVCVFVPIGTFLVYRATHGISRVTAAANEAAQGFLDTSLEVDTVGEVGELQKAFQQMSVSLRNNMQRIEYLAHVDNITGLPNRLKFGNVATQMIDLSPRAEGGLLFIDLDRFKAVNDAHGHSVGDRLLLMAGERVFNLIEKHAQPKCTGKPFISRFSGDEFIVILPGVTDAETLKELADLIVEKMAEHFRVDNLKLVVRASIGVALYPQDADSSEELLKCADMAMFAAKEAGRDQSVVFNEKIREKAIEREKIERHLRTALENDELKVYYQPKLDLKSGRIMGSEALLRWQHPELGNVPPWKFIPLAEECGLMTSIGEFVLRKSLEDMNVLRHEGSDLSIAVNVAPVQFESPAFTDRTLGILGESGFPLEKLELEITESSIMDDPKKVFDQIMPIKEEGVLFAIDDFGTGYSSLNTLATMPFDTLKIDRSFVMDMADSEDRRAIVQLILMMAQQLRMRTVAEGIETSGQFDHLKAWGANYAQGYLWSPPVDYARFRELVKESEASAKVAIKDIDQKLRA
ncbi:putative bifunctional diguanylate cyclase/phosphodiesterase [Roseibium sp.]|uniref:putative bifunctional diguanylate cyclase/phosphodiesterase n=1 Tax=Roseibium sp. TaxID=1936156 RepID=UPI003A97E444